MQKSDASGFSVSEFEAAVRARSFDVILKPAELQPRGALPQRSAAKELKIRGSKTTERAGGAKGTAP